MSDTGPITVADSILMLLVTLVQARKQARWQWKHCAGEHKHKWTVVVDRLDHRIETGERMVAERMEMFTFHTKREIVE